jgi:hypothetical protein
LNTPTFLEAQEYNTPAYGMYEHSFATFHCPELRVMDPTFISVKTPLAEVRPGEYQRAGGFVIFQNYAVPPLGGPTNQHAGISRDDTAWMMLVVASPQN